MGGRGGQSCCLARSVLGTPSLPLGDAERVKRATDDLITDAGEVANAAATDQYDRVFLQRVAPRPGM